jgi:hypothetical protein
LLQLSPCPDSINFFDEIIKLKEEKCITVILLLWLWWHERIRRRCEK